MHAYRFFAAALSSCCTAVFGDSRSIGTGSPVADRCSGRVAQICSQLRLSLITVYTTGGIVCWGWRCRITTSASTSPDLAVCLMVWNKSFFVQVRKLPTYTEYKRNSTNKSYTADKHSHVLKGVARALWWIALCVLWKCKGFRNDAPQRMRPFKVLSYTISLYTFSAIRTYHNSIELTSLLTIQLYYVAVNFMLSASCVNQTATSVNFLEVHISLHALIHNWEHRCSVSSAQNLVGTKSTYEEDYRIHKKIR